MKTLSTVVASISLLALLAGCGQGDDGKKSKAAVEKAEARAEKAEARAEKAEKRADELQKKLAAERKDDRKDDKKDAPKKK